MNLAILIGHFPPAAYGGAELQAEGWARRLALRHAVTVITRADALKAPGREARDGFTVLRTPVSGLPGWRTLADLGAIGRAVASLAPRPDLLLCFQTFISGLAGTRSGRRAGIPAVVWIRGEAEYRLADSAFHRWLSPRVWSDAAGVLVQSEANRDALLAELERAAPERAAGVRAKLDVVGNGLELPPVTPLPEALRVLCVGRLIADKGVDVVIDACAREHLPLIVAGDGPERAALEQRARALGVDARFTGHLERAALAPLYREAGVMVLAARRGEGLPNVLLEAMAHGRPVIATPCAGTRDLLRDGVNGLSVPPGDVAKLALALGALRDGRPLATRLAAAARTTAEAHEWSRVEPRLEAALERWRRR